MGSLGLEDNTWMDPASKQELTTNGRLIERAVAVAGAHGREIATGARRLLRIKHWSEAGRPS
jgi:uncharacterized protein (DUF849 family)